MQKFRQPLRFSRGYVPTQQIAGDANDTVYAGENVVFKGNGSSIYAEAYRGTLTRATSSESQYACLAPPTTGLSVTATKGITEVIYPLSASSTPGVPDPRFRVGQQIRMGPLGAGKHYYVTYSNYHTTAGFGAIGISPPFLDNNGSYEVFVLPTLCVVNEKLGLTYGAGNIIQLPKGHLLTTGVMPVTKAWLFRRAGGVHAEPPLTESTADLHGNPALLPTTPLPPFSQEIPLGLSTPPPPALGFFPGTGKNMPAGRYSVRVCRSRLETAGYGNPSEAAEIVIQEGQRIHATIPNADPGQTAWRIFVTLFAIQEGISGPWYELMEISEADVVAAPSRIIALEWRDYEVAGAQLVTFDNDPAPPARFVVMFGGIPVLLSTLGTPVTTGVDFAPGPSVQPSKAYNIEGFPRTASLAVGPVQDIVSFVEGEGRLYVVTANYLHVVTLTGNPEQPLTVRPFAQTSILRHNNIIYVGGVLYAFTARGPARFSGEGVSEEDITFATPVKSITDKWFAAKVFVVHDPLNEAILYVHSQDSKDPTPGPNNGKYRTMVLSYYLTLGVWSTPIWIWLEGQDTYVSGVATLGGRTYFITNNTLQQWDGLPGGFISWYMTTPYIDQGAEGLEKNIRQLSVTHRGQNSRAVIYGAEVDQPIVDLATNNATGGQTPEIVLPRPGGSTPADNTDPNTDRLIATHTERPNVRNLRLYAVKILGVSTRDLETATSKHTEPDRVDEIVVAGNVHGPTN